MFGEVKWIPWHDEQQAWAGPFRLLVVKNRGGWFQAYIQGHGKGKKARSVEAAKAAVIAECRQICQDTLAELDILDGGEGDAGR